MKGRSGSFPTSTPKYGKRKLQSGSTGCKHAQPNRSTPSTGPAARGSTSRQGNTSSVPSKAGNPVIGKSPLRGDGERYHASGGHRHPAVEKSRSLGTGR